MIPSILLAVNAKSGTEEMLLAAKRLVLGDESTVSMRVYFVVNQKASEPTVSSCMGTGNSTANQRPPVSTAKFCGQPISSQPWRHGRLSGLALGPGLSLRSDSWASLRPVM